MVMDPQTGEILVMLGSLDFYDDEISGNVNNLLAPNSPGSTFKPFVYLDGIATKNWNPSTIFQDVPITFVESNGATFSPTDPIKTLQVPISMRNALGNSLNIPAFRAALDLGVPSVVDFGHRFGFTSLNNIYGPSIAIGGIDLRAIDLVRGYSVLANGGRMVGQDMIAPDSPDESMLQPVSILKIEDRNGNVLFDINDHRETNQVVTPQQAYMITDILSDPSAQCLTFGCGGISVPGYQVAVKTGTSEPFDPAGPNRGKIGETWAFGYTRDYAVGVWAGNSDNAAIDNIFSTSISYRAMRDILLMAYNGKPQTPFLR
jgi:membrane peptidoglycan carboxypeptidase